MTVVGVLPSFRLGSILDRGVLTVFRPLAQLPVVTDLPHAMFVRVRGDPRVVAASVRHAVQGMRADLPAVTVQWMRDALAPEYRPWEVAATMFSLFGAVALAIAVVGLYGVVAFAAAQRAQEVAIRCVLGARPHHVLATVARPALAAVAVGLAAGALAVVAAHRWLAPLLFGVSARDPRTIAVVALVLATVAGAASLTPVLRTLRRPPAAVLRQE